MFLPFFIALCAVLSALAGKNKTGYVLFFILLVMTLLLFRHHATDSLSLSF
ncbi:DUF5993 family protein [Xanthomonas cassavae CFBP 4642]|uniref:DUF5993 family protein n=1 Tax=Xanthomonas cassavae CFBP 4642 TaxID=1219375 RepID=A0ABS8HMF1_9XANT|nr:DUF5993 family protein [Xanthomonas cassavae CFBP 4642]